MPINICNNDLEKQVVQAVDGEPIAQVPIGLLDGLTLYRFCHMLRRSTGGGVESYLSAVNRLLLERNKIRILQTYVVPENEKPEVEIEQVGQGELVWIPSTYNNIPVEQVSYAKRLTAKLRGRPLSGFMYNHERAFSNLASYAPSLALFHWISEDSKIIIDYLNRNDVPFVMINHFHNKRLKLKMIRQQISKARAVAGVSEVDVPGFLRNRFFNLSDGIDTDFFSPHMASSIGIKPEGAMIFFPSRIYKEKGHLDAVRALGLLARSGVKAVLAFAGREESQDFIKKLKRVISEEGVQERVIFVGELCLEDLRNWYAASDLVVLPSYSEGLGRVLLEAQAMERPVLAYDVGGTREAFLEGVSGFLLKRGDIAGLARQLQYLLGNKSRLSAMGERGRQFVVDRFSLDSLAMRHERFYANALKLSR